jgi:hypothetical protein
MTIKNSEIWKLLEDSQKSITIDSQLLCRLWKPYLIEVTFWFALPLDLSVLRTIITLPPKNPGHFGGVDNVFITLTFDMRMKKLLHFGKLFCFWLMTLTILSASMSQLDSAHAQSAIGKTVLWPKECGTATSIENAYDINFGTFNGSEVFDGTKTNTGTVNSGGNALLHTSNVPSVGIPDYYLVVLDKCATLSWHADILASSMTDQNIANSVTWTAIPAANLKLQNDGIAYFLDTSPSNFEVSANAVGSDTSFNTALQLLQRSAWANPVWWKYGVKPTYRLVIPQFQHVDTYKGTITRTVI